MITWAPRLVAHWVRIRPTPPAPACSSTVSPDCTGYTDLISKWAVIPLRIAAAATSDGHRIRHRGNDIDGCDTVLGVGADGVGGRDPVTHTQRGHAFTHRCHRARHFGAEDERQFVRIQPRPKIGVDEIHADRLGLDHHLAGPGGGLRLVDQGKDLRSAGVLDFNRVHVQAFQSAATAAVDGFSDNSSPRSRCGDAQHAFPGGESWWGPGRTL